MLNHAHIIIIMTIMAYTYDKNQMNDLIKYAYDRTFP